MISRSEFWPTVIRVYGRDLADAYVIAEREGRDLADVLSDAFHVGIGYELDKHEANMIGKLDAAAGVELEPEDWACVLLEHLQTQRYFKVPSNWKYDPDDVIAIHTDRRRHS